MRAILAALALTGAGPVNVSDVDQHDAAPSHLLAAAAPVAVVHADSLDVLRALPDGSVDLIYVDPPFNTGVTRRGGRVLARADGDAERIGFAGRRYATTTTVGAQYGDDFDDFLGWLEPRLRESHRVLAEHGTLYFHIDPRESHYCKVLLDAVFGRDAFLNEIIWAYDYGARTRRRWPAKHDVILVYVRNRDLYHFDSETVDREPYMAPGLQTPERALRGKLPTDVWWHTIVPTASKERTGYPTQKPLGILRRIISASSRPGAVVLDWCAGSGTTGAAAIELGRRAILVDSNRDAVDVMVARLSDDAKLADVPFAAALGGP